MPIRVYIVAANSPEPLLPAFRDPSTIAGKMSAVEILDLEQFRRLDQTTAQRLAGELEAILRDHGAAG